MKDSAPTDQEVFEEALRLYKELLIPFIQIKRDIPFPDSPNRQENDAEHSFSIAVIAITIAERMKLDLDTGLVAKYALVHDLVEAYAGDISVRDHKRYAQKHIEEEKALKKIEKDFSRSAPWMVDLIKKYEEKSDNESKFIYAVDKMMGAIVRLAGDGIDWTHAYPDKDGTSYRKVVRMLRKKAETFPEIISLFDYIHDHLDKKRLDYHERDEGKQG